MLWSDHLASPTITSSISHPLILLRKRENYVCLGSESTISFFFCLFLLRFLFLCTAGLWGGRVERGSKKGEVDLSSRQSPQINIKNTLHFSILLPLLSSPYFDSIFYEMLQRLIEPTPVDIDKLQEPVKRCNFCCLVTHPEKHIMRKR